MKRAEDRNAIGASGEMRVPRVRLSLIGCILLSASIGLSAPHNDADRARLAQHLIRAAGISRGLCSVMGCRDGELLLALAGQSQLLIHAIDPDRSAVAAARKQIDAVGLHGRRVIVEPGTFGTLPYADNLVDIVLVPDLSEDTFAALSISEILRVLRPKGILILGSVTPDTSGTPTAEDLARRLRASNPGDFTPVPGAPGAWVMVSKPEPEGVDDWSHWQHGPDNNPASQDRIIRAPYLTQWTGTPYYIAMPAITVAAGGRTFCAMGHIAHHEREEPWLNTVLARNGYNGIELWRRNLPPGYLVHRSAFVATDDVFYMIDEDGNGCRMLDPQTGRDLGEIRIGELSGEWKWIAIDDGVLYVLAGMQKDPRETLRVKNPRSYWGWSNLSRGYYQRQIPWGFGRTIAAYDLDEKRLLWTHEEEAAVDSRAMAVGDGNIFFYGPASHAGCIRGTTGKVLWTNPSPRLREWVRELEFDPKSMEGFRTEPFCLYTPEALILAPQTSPNVCAVSTKDGNLLWHRRKTGGNPNPLYADGKVLIGIGPERNTLALDPRTGRTVEDLGFRKYNCARLTATPDSLFCRGYPEGTTRYDRETKRLIFNGAMRPSCNDGVVPANGMLYIGPWLCDCNLALMGAMALGPAGDFRFDHPFVESERLEVVAENTGDVAALETSPDDWPTYRANNDRTASTGVRIPGRVTQRWTCAPEQAVTAAPPTSAGNRVFLCGFDGKVRAIDGKSGTLQWSFLTAGPVRASATIWNGRVYVGSGDGYVYCLEAATGRLLWRFRAAPVERRIMIYDHLCSSWPVNSGVLVREGVACFAAGLIDTDGTYVYALDAITGKLKWQNNSSGHLNPDIRKGVSAHGRLTIANGHLYMAGGNIVSPAVYDLDTGECKNPRNVEGPPAANRGEEIAVIAGKYVLLGGRLLFSALDNVVNPGHFDVIRLDGAKAALHLFDGKIPPAWDDDAVVYVQRRQGRIRCCGVDGLKQVMGKPPRSEWALGKRWTVEDSQLLDTVSVAMASNAAVAVCEMKVEGESTPAWGVVAIGREDGNVLWQHRLPHRPLAGGLLIDREGRVIVTLEDGALICLGRQ